MTGYRWSCLACEASNEATAQRCTRCECPSTPNATEVESHKAHFASTHGKPYECFKCGHGKYEVGEARMSGGMLSSFFEVESEKFSFVACARCGYTEFYRGKRSALRNLADWGIS
jgi:predicted nucleic-acid-binding Zn-ribbon protein